MVGGFGFGGIVWLLYVVFLICCVLGCIVGFGVSILAGGWVGGLILGCLLGAWLGLFSGLLMRSWFFVCCYGLVCGVCAVAGWFEPVLGWVCGLVFCCWVLYVLMFTVDL